jgi:hypothetical protein
MADPADKTTPVAVDLDPVTSLCTSQSLANVMTGMFTRACQEHFSDPNNMAFNAYTEEGKEMLEDYIWTPDNTTTKIQIQPVWMYNSQDIQRRPAIYVKRGKWHTSRLAINDGMTVGAVRNAQGGVERVEGEYHVRQVDGSHIVHCVGRSGAEAELLGQEVLEYFMSFAPVLRQEMKLHYLEVSDVDEVKMLDEDVERFVTPVILSYTFMRSWRLEQQAPWLKALAIDLAAK